MRILIYGECGDYGSGAWCYLNTLVEMGHEVKWVHTYAGIEMYRKSVAWKIIRKLNSRNPLPYHLTQHNRIVFENVKECLPDIVIILKGLFIKPEVIDLMKKTGAWVVNINHDDFFSFNPNNRSEIQLRALPYYNHIFTTREINVEEVKPYNSKVSFFPFAYYPAIHRILDLSEKEKGKWTSDVLFVGTWEKERASFLEQLVRIVPANYAIYGSQWDKVATHSPLKPFLKMRELHGDEMAYAIRYAKMSLGFLRKENRDDYTQRTFEIPACGGLLLAERTPRHLKFYRDKEEAVFFDASHPEELAGSIRWLLSHPDMNEAIRKAGNLRLVSSHHTYKDRMNQLFAVYESR